MSMLRVIVTSIAAAAVVSTGGCKGASSRAVPSRGQSSLVSGASGTGRTVVLVTIDGVAWRDLFAVDEPALADPLARMPLTKMRVESEGVVIGGGNGRHCGVVAPANPTFISLPGYSEILSGRRTPCRSNECTIGTPTVLDIVALGAASPGEGGAASIASWSGIANVASSGAGPVVTSAGRGRWANGPIVDRALANAVVDGEQRYTDSPGDEMYRPDERTAAVALAYLRAERPRLLHVALGDTDEYAHGGDREAYVRALGRADRFIAALEETLDEQVTRAAIVVTTDHGRGLNFRDHGSAFPESGRSFVLAFGDGIATRGIVCDHRSVILPDVGATIRRLLDLRPDTHLDAGKPIFDMLEDPSASG